VNDTDRVRHPVVLSGRVLARIGLCAIALAACRDVPPAFMPPDGAGGDAQSDSGGADKSAGCVDTFGQSLGDGFGRLDGTLVAVVPPGSSCPRPNSTHIILEIRVGSEVYRMVTAVVSTIGNPNMAIAERDAPLAGPPWSEGWHLGVTFDFVDTMGLHRLDFAPKSKAEMTAAITAPLEPGAHISVFGTVEGQPDSGHLVHRNTPGADGAIVVGPEASPHYVMLRFDNQLF
jgi:hypothetical protein